jgi:hypothetical protein
MSFGHGVHVEISICQGVPNPEAMVPTASATPQLEMFEGCENRKTPVSDSVCSLIGTRAGRRAGPRFGATHGVDQFSSEVVFHRSSRETNAAPGARVLAGPREREPGAASIGRHAGLDRLR